jgi:hypothetical protein
LTLTTDTIHTLSLLAARWTPINIMKLIQIVDSLPDDQKAELMALLWSGRDGGNFADYLKGARKGVDDSVGYYMAEQGPALAEYLQRGLDQINQK